MRTVHLVAAARPNFMKVAPLWDQLAAALDFAPVLIHSGQHQDRWISDAILRYLDLPEHDHHLGVGSGTHAEQTGRMTMASEPVLEAEPPTGGVGRRETPHSPARSSRSKPGCAPCILRRAWRSRDRAMPEKINGLAVDAIYDVPWTPSPDADENLADEGHPATRITRVGNIMIDSFELARPAIESADRPGALGLPAGGYGVETLHRPSNVDDAPKFARHVDALIAVARRRPLAWPVYPRTAARLTSQQAAAL